MGFSFSEATGGATLRCGQQAWSFSSDEWWLLNRLVHWSSLYGASPPSFPGRVVTSGGDLGEREVLKLSAWIQATRELRSPLEVGTDKYATVASFSKEWREFLRAQGVRYVSHSSSGASVFCGKTNLSKTDTKAKADVISALPMLQSLLGKLTEATRAALGTNAPPLSVELEKRWESL